MIIKVNTKLFTIEPDVRFSREQNVPRGFWLDLLYQT